MHAPHNVADHKVVTPDFATISKSTVASIERRVRGLCLRYADRLPFHGWHHVSFVRAKAAYFAAENGANTSVVETAALVHDVNYLVQRNSPAAAGHSLRMDLLSACGVPDDVARWIDDIIDEAEMCTRGPHISLEGQALSDADTLFKALPITPVMLSHRYLEENDLSLRELADKIVGEQQDVHDQGFYFYNAEAAASYGRWAKANLELWQCIREAVDDPVVEELLDAVNEVDAAAS
ncbi:HD family phosphohydrolase [Amycolatopsis nigrescens]|uniref:HD family phosphohydrolase n=1 Tax=Amycolatopsis nigrescens TaxID=381445 RepID=UPI0003A07C21|nr:HD family phosphohydrolase [Amycolatopsis nigrescens]